MCYGWYISCHCHCFIPVPSYTAWWQKDKGVNNLPKVAPHSAVPDEDSIPRPLDRDVHTNRGATARPFYKSINAQMALLRRSDASIYLYSKISIYRLDICISNRSHGPCPLQKYALSIRDTKSSRVHSAWRRRPAVEFETISGCRFFRCKSIWTDLEVQIIVTSAQNSITNFYWAFSNCHYTRCKYMHAYRQLMATSFLYLGSLQSSDGMGVALRGCTPTSRRAKISSKFAQFVGLRSCSHTFYASNVH